LKKYENIPTSLADACLVRMAELHDSSSILTLDADFQIYRKHKRRVIPLLLPPAIA
jgi:predicted nucleic acid-binding protein